MAKVIIRSNVADPNFLVSQKVLEVPLNKPTIASKTDIIISPIGGASVSVDDFTSGILEEPVKSINFSQSGNKIIATVEFLEYTFDQQVTIIDLPISGVPAQTSSGIKLIEISPIDNTLISNASSYGKTSSRLVAKDSIVEHAVVGDVGKTVNILTKSFIVPSGYKFTKQPSYKISGSARGYKITTKDTVNSKGVIIGKTFNVSFTFDNIIRNERIDTITFSYSIKKVKETVVEATTKEEEKIYSIDTGREIGPEGGLKTVVVKGVPGSRFRIMTQNSSNQAYDYKTGQFGNGGGYLEGVIPAARAGFGYGEFKANIRVPASTTGETVNTTINTKKAIDHKKLATAIKLGTTENMDIENAPAKKYKDIQKEDVTLNISVKDGGESNYTIATPLFKHSKPTDANVLKEHLFFKHMGALEKSGSYDFHGKFGKEIIGRPLKLKFGKDGFIKPNTIEFVVLALADNKFVRVNRQPRLNTTKKSEYVRASESVGSTPDKGSVGGVLINMDAGSSVRHSVTSDTSDGTTIDFGSDIKFKVGVRGIGPRVEHGVATMRDKWAYKAVTISVSMFGTMPKSDVNMEINANNFLTIFSL